MHPGINFLTTMFMETTGRRWENANTSTILTSGTTDHRVYDLSDCLPGFVIFFALRCHNDE